ncbi:MAG: hypothetical protein IIB54_04510 [Planctomycetes bacterium]|nr:hypothetical protein [Planctomycetota bacterium]
MKTPVALVLLISLIAPICGCATGESQSFPGYDGRVVWTALTAVAQSPSYDDLEPDRRWIVDENEVWADEPGGRIEIFRRVYRMEGILITDQHRNERTWRFQVLFHDGNTPSASFHARGLSIPMQAQAEADSYFAEVRELLRGIEDLMPEKSEAASPIKPPTTLPAPSEEEIPASQPASQPVSQPDKTLEEILDPGGS